ncbi:MAG: CopG family transcriptional regulator [Candidatus Lokiarchaeota archaeon]|nr:CopG family transcriptional regulator [Candidatus Lokiarchaeota archaeon]
MLEVTTPKKRKYRTVRIPEALVDSVLEIINDTENLLGYRTHSEFIIDAIRRRVEVLSPRSSD